MVLGEFQGVAPLPFMGDAYPALELTHGPLLGPPLKALENADHEQWPMLLGWQQAFAPGIGPRAETTLFLGQATFFIGLIVAAPLFLGRALMRLQPNGIALQLSPLADARVSRCVHVQVLCERGEPGDREMMENLIEPLISGLSRRAGIGRAALWRVAGDGIAAAFLDLGRRCQNVDMAEALFQTILKGEGSRFSNRQLTWPDDHPEGVLLRGGCCRIYQSKGMPLCPGCVLASRKRL